MAKAYPCIGGPLDGEFATTGDFEGDYPYVKGTKRRDYDAKRIEGMYEHLASSYVQFNQAGNNWNKDTRRIPPMIWLHTGLLVLPVPPKER